MSHAGLPGQKERPNCDIIERVALQSKEFRGRGTEVSGAVALSAFPAKREIVVASLQNHGLRWYHPRETNCGFLGSLDED